MKLGFLALPSRDRRLYVDEAAARRGVSPVVVEKDFWVSWMLALLFKSDCADALVFKGGTSLSKVFGAIDRFSEDIDLSLAPAFVGVQPPASEPSRTQADLWMSRAQKACGEAVAERIRPSLAALAREAFGTGISQRLVLDGEGGAAGDGDGTTLLFHYPSVLPSGLDYIKRSVRLEFGSLTAQQPTGRHAVRPWIAEALPDAFADWSCEVVALEAERTFWEKATILHVEHHRPADRPMPERYSRHYADLAMLASHPTIARAADREELCERVVRWKQSFFGSAWARYDLARRGSFRLLPAAARTDPLRRDDAAMREMYLAAPPSFDEVLATLARLEERINA